MQSIEDTYRCCMFGIEYAFKQRDKFITKWWSIQIMVTFNANIAPIPWEENVQRISFSVRIYE